MGFRMGPVLALRLPYCGSRWQSALHGAAIGDAFSLLRQPNEFFPVEDERREPGSSGHTDACLGEPEACQAGTQETT